jgi:D-glycero-D-manno-heptose 1,7-bisphosphate phosphatase
LSGRGEGRAAVFLDRDGTIIEDVPYLDRPEDVRLISGAGSAIVRLNRRGIPAILVTNQSGIARGFYTADTVDAIHRRLRTLLGEEGAAIDAVYYCPHMPPEQVPPGTSPCTCRKPEIGLVEQARREHDLDLERSFFVGDRMTDVEVAQRMGGTGILIQSGHGQGSLDESSINLGEFRVCRNLPDAVDLVISLISRT